MTRFKLFRLKNAMLVANGISNAIGVSIVFFLGYRGGFRAMEDIRQVGDAIDRVFLPLSFMIPIVATVLYERPVRAYLARIHNDQPISKAASVAAKRRLLNEPFFLIGVALTMWIAASVLYPSAYWWTGAEPVLLFRAFFTSLFTGLITVTIAFFVFEHVLRDVLAPFFFPNGGLYAVPKTVRIRIRTRLAAFLFACNIVPFLALLNLVLSSAITSGSPSDLLGQLRSGVLVDSVIFIGVGIWVTVLVSGNLTGPLEEIIRVLRGVKDGDFDRMVRVTSNDEIGYAGDVINEMNTGLKERDFIMETFGKYVASEVRDEVLSGRIPFDGETREVTILFADLRDFTPMTESHDPKQVVNIMNRYFETMAEAIRQEGGLILQFLGDEIYAVFGAPVSRPDHPDSAVKAAASMNRRLAGLNESFSRKGWPFLRHGIGIHTGTAVAASIGSPDRLSYLLVGATVNLASRLQDLTKEMEAETIVSDATCSRLQQQYPLKRLPPVVVKGTSEPVCIYALG